MSTIYNSLTGKVMEFKNCEHAFRKTYHDQVGRNFNFDKLLSLFAKCMPDIKNDDIAPESTSEVVKFAKHIIFTVGPEAARLKKACRDESWKFNSIVNGEPMCIVVKTFNNSNYPEDVEFKDGQLTLTVDRAGLLALHIYERLTPTYVKNKNFVLSPLAAKLFSKSDIIKIASALHCSGAASDEQVSHLIMEINESCHSGGQHLPYSTAEMALLSVACSTAHLGSEGKRNEIINGIVMKYIRLGKGVNLKRFKILSNFAIGGLQHQVELEATLARYQRQGWAIEK